MGGIEWFLTAYLVGRMWRAMSRKGTHPMVKEQVPHDCDEIDIALKARRDAWHRHIVTGDIRAAIDDVRAMDDLLDAKIAQRQKVKT